MSCDIVSIFYKVNLKYPSTFMLEIQAELKVQHECMNGGRGNVKTDSYWYK